MGGGGEIDFDYRMKICFPPRVFSNEIWGNFSSLIGIIVHLGDNLFKFTLNILC